MAAAITMDNPMNTLPKRIPRAVFWSSSISFTTENGEIFTMMKKATAKITIPKALKVTIDTKLLIRLSANMILSPLTLK
jgi:hypothetical protein